MAAENDHLMLSKKFLNNIVEPKKTRSTCAQTKRLLVFFCVLGCVNSYIANIKLFFRTNYSVREQIETIAKRLTTQSVLRLSFKN